MTKAKIDKPERMCVGCRTLRPKREMLRIVLNKNGECFADPTGKAPGRGAYICKNIACVDEARKNKAFSHSFKQGVSGAIYDEAANIIASLNGEQEQ